MRGKSSDLSEKDKAEKAAFWSTIGKPTKQSDKLAMEWFKSHNNIFSGFVNNVWLPTSESAAIAKVSNLLSLEHYADVSVASEDTLKEAAANSYLALETWKLLPGREISKCLIRIAENIKKHQKLFALVESASSGKLLFRTQTKDVPNLIESFEYYASLALMLEYYKSAKGVVCVIAEEYNEPTLSVSWRVSSLLAAGNVVLLLVDEKTCLSAFLLAELCSSSGLPAGVLNVLPINQSSLSSLPKIDKVFFTGEYTRSTSYIKMAATLGIACEVLITKRPVVIVYEDSDLSAAANGVMETLCFGDTRSERSGCKVFVQCSVQKKFVELLERKFSKLRLSKDFSDSDMSCVVTKEQYVQLSKKCQEATKQAIKIVQGPDVCDENKQFRPTLMCNVVTTSKLISELGNGPLVVTESFRTAKESVELFNADKLGYDVSIFTSDILLALDVSNKLKAGTIWMNSGNVFDASLVYGRSGIYAISAEGGEETFYRHLRTKGGEDTEAEVKEELNSYGTKILPGVVIKSDTKIKQSYGLHIGGSYTEPSGSTYIVVDDAQNLPLAYVANGSSSDIQKAIASAVVSQQKWECQSQYKRSQVLRKVASVLEEKKVEFASILNGLIGFGLKSAMLEIDGSISRLHFWINHSFSTFNSSLDRSPHYNIYQTRRPIGVIGIQSPSEMPILSFLSLVAPAIVSGNAVVVIPSDKYPLIALKMCEIFTSSGCPGGILNIITGSRKTLTGHLCGNSKINAVWFGVDGAAFIYNSSSDHPKRVFDCRYTWDLYEETKLMLVSECTQPQTVYLPRPGIFPN